MDKTILFIILISGVVVLSEASLQVDLINSRVFDTNLYKQVINSTECQRQMTYLKSTDIILLAQFLDSGVRLPRGILTLVVTDLGNYKQCLEIDEEIEDMKIQGKYAYFSVPFNQTLKLPFLYQPNVKNKKKGQFKSLIQDVQAFTIPNVDIDSLEPDNPLSFAEFNFAACMPKSCTLNEWIKNILFDVSDWGVKVEEVFYRLPNDKPWVAADYVATVIFSTLALITVLSTLYDINHIVIKKQDPKKGNTFYRTFSVYTNTRRLLTFTPNPNALECLDGIRCISMMWVILGHVFPMHNFNANLTDALLWVTSGDAVIVTTGLFTVDSFFMMAGLLLVYTTVGKFSGPQLLKRLHAFYLNRFLRMFPLLAALVLLEASIFHRVMDGPYWTHVAGNTEYCRSFWWSTLLHIQNYVNPDNICIRHSWYLAIDIQLHIISPIILYWVLSKNKKAAWAALVIALLAILTGSTIYNFIMEFPSSTATLVRMGEQTYYVSWYYMNTLCRGSSFFVGMITGYIINMYKGKELKLSKIFLLISWTIALLLIAVCFYFSYEIMQFDWDNQVGDSLFNSFARVIWCTGLSWIIFACVKGYGGPINWLLTLNMWKLPARISYAMYLYHYSFTFMYAGAQIQPIYFSVGGRLYDFLAFLFLTFILAFVVTVVIDAPFTILIKMVMEGGPKRRLEKNGNHKQGPPKIKDVTELESDIITTLQKDPSTIVKNKNFLEGNGFDTNGRYLEKNQVPFGKNGALVEKSGPPVDGNEPDSQLNETSAVTKNKAI